LGGALHRGRTPSANQHRLLEPIGYIPPAEAEADYRRQQAQAWTTNKPAQSAALQEG